ncbi:MAG: molybdate ABC transporter substrate-binding protein [Verrucomicrobiales bacterium]|nr:molybdate ABC transporter substrate-binding protein [Verrucomicrobiales bacterium]
MSRLPIIAAAALLAIAAILLFLRKPGQGADVAIAVASNFDAPAKAIAAAFEKETGFTVSLSTGSTGKHYAQIKRGAPFDIFLAADTKRPELLEQEGFGIENTLIVYAMGRLVLWSPDSTAFTDGIQFLRENSFRYIALANPELAPYGSAAVEVLNSLGVSSESKWVRGENISQTFHFVKSEAADAGFVALSQVRSLNETEKGSQWIVPAERHPPIEQAAILLNDTPAAREFVSYLESAEAKAIIHNFGYDLP